MCLLLTDKMKSVVQQEFLKKRCQVVLQTELNSGNKMKGIRMSMHGAHHIKSNVDQFKFLLFKASPSGPSKLYHYNCHYSKLLTGGLLVE